MGTTQSHFETQFQICIAMDIYLKSEFDDMLNLDVLKTNDCLKTKLKNIILTALITKGNHNVSIDDTDLWLVSKMDKSDIQYLELNAVVDFYESTLCEIPDNLRRMKKMKLCIVSEFFTYTLNKLNIIISPDTTVVLLYNTLYNIAVYKNPNSAPVKK
jgi:hypothetical protein